ncbi:putative isoprenylcysteine carboxyl methyltransferase [Golovinomyces cichoracearum]|uniref:Protein-S-isoprenylcysteine O-methyltransferase n=1 Tax=Golovinomyces cichoracearum TaxID=62708 RepID=A0A420ID22_9PEZI|nr:putative isoprenylcysteine carboxyl methyltransferase [Golovinomyces cichoracearum]
MEIDLSLSTLSLIAAYIGTAYLVDRSITPPNPAPSSKIEYDSDSMQVVHKLYYMRPAICLLYLLHLAQILFPKNRSDICLNPDLLSLDMYRWSPTTVSYFLIIFVAATSRMAAYAQLGKNFTYRLATPSGLIKTGFYAYVQHPSYTALLIVASVNGFTMLRLDCSLACVVPRYIATSTWNPLIGIAMTVAVFFLIYFRVRDEETMMKGAFGAEWEDWNRKTKKFIPFLV